LYKPKKDSMKKLYFSILSLFFCLAVLKAQTVPTCSFDPIFVASPKVGVWPDSATNFVSGVVGQPYEQNITIKVPKDTLAAGLRFCFNKFTLYTPTVAVNYNLPPGLQIGSSMTVCANGTVNAAPSLRFPGNAISCASIYGTPTVAGSYTLQLEIQPYLNGPVFTPCPTSPNINGGSTSLAGPQVLGYYIINISTPTGLIDIGKDRMTLYQNVPNPSSSTTDVKFYVEGEDDAIISVYNTLGDKVSEQKIRTTVGENKVSIDVSDLASGTYIYSLKYKNAITTKRMVVINN
jgi:hypothetical protein